MNAKVLLVSFFLIFAQTTAVFAQNLADIQQRGVLRVGFENNYAPFEMDGKDGNVGFDVEIARGFARELGVKVEFVDLEWDSLLPSLDNGSVDMVISAMTITTERREKADFSSPYFVSGQAILLNRSKASAIKSFRDLNTPSVHIIEKQGTFADSFVKTFFSKAKLTVIDAKEDDIVNMVAEKQADVFVYDLPYLAIAALQDKERLSLIDVPFTYEPFGAAFKRGSTLKKPMDNYIAKIKANGEYDKLYRYWFLSTDWLEVKAQK